MKRRLDKLNIDLKYQDDICDGVKIIIDDSLDNIIEQSIEETRIIQGLESLVGK